MRVRVRVRSLAWFSGLKDPVLPRAGGVGRTCGLDQALLWQWHRPAAAALVQPLAWELPHAMGVALKKKKERDRQTDRKKENFQKVNLKL